MMALKTDAPQRAMGWVRRVLDWDESQDPSAAPKKPKGRPWGMLGQGDQDLLNALGDGFWVHEGHLREVLGWGRLRFFVATVRMVNSGWIEARSIDGSIFKSEYRLSPTMWQ